MSQMGVSVLNCDACQKMLSQLPGVFAAGMRFDGEELTEIHILASTSRSAKQIVRDVQSAIYAVYGEDVDHRIISVAQLPQYPSVAEEVQEAVVQQVPVRLLISGVEFQRRGGHYTVRIFLNNENDTFVGEAHCHDNYTRRNRVVAQATLNAVNAYLERDAFELMDVRTAEFGGEDVVITMVEQSGAEPRVLVGAVPAGADLVDSVVRSTLDAVNRRLGLMRRGEIVSI